MSRTPIRPELVANVVPDDSAPFERLQQIFFAEVLPRMRPTFEDVDGENAADLKMHANETAFLMAVSWVQCLELLLEERRIVRVGSDLVPTEEGRWTSTLREAFANNCLSEEEVLSVQMAVAERLRGDRALWALPRGICLRPTANGMLAVRGLVGAL
jgi:hypothetical protein